MSKNRFKHNGLKLLLRFMKENGLGFQAVTMDRKVMRAIEEQRISIWTYPFYLRNIGDNEFSDKWRNYIIENGYYDIIKHYGDNIKFIICKRNGKVCDSQR